MELSMISAITDPRFAALLATFSADLETIRTNCNLNKISWDIRTARRRIDRQHRLILSANPINGSIRLALLYQKKTIVSATCLEYDKKHTIYSVTGDIDHYAFNKRISREEFYQLMEQKYPPFFEWLLWNQL